MVLVRMILGGTVVKVGVGVLVRVGVQVKVFVGTGDPPLVPGITIKSISLG